MVLSHRGCNRPLGLAILTATVVLASAPANAQSSIDSDSRPFELAPEYNPLGVRLGQATLYPALSLLAEHDSNIYAEPENEKDDRILYLVPRLRAEVTGGAWQFRGIAQAQVRRYLKYKTENSTSGLVEGDARWSPREGETFRANGSWQRLTEDRGDPEASDNPNARPRRLNLFRGELHYRREGGTWLLGVGGQVNRFDYLAGADVFRDHSSYAGQASLGRRVGGLTYVTVTTFVNRLEFNRADITGINRDATTYGVRGGVTINPGGILHGEASIGAFRFEPKDKAIGAYTGLSLAGNLVYRPTQRTTLILESFRGNVATFRAGAVSRTDTRFQMTLQQEIRHNLFGRLAGYSRNSDYRGNRKSERTRGVEAEIDYLLNRHVAVSFNARYANRSSADPLERFGRFRATVGVRLRL